MAPLAVVVADERGDLGLELHRCVPAVQFSRTEARRIAGRYAVPFGDTLPDANATYQWEYKYVNLCGTTSSYTVLGTQTTDASGHFTSTSCTCNTLE